MLSLSSSDCCSRVRVLMFLGMGLGRNSAWASSIPSWASVSRVAAATTRACESSASGSGVQLTLVLAAKQARGLASSPTLAIPCFLHSTRVVPVPQNGSSTASRDVKPKRSIYSRTRCGGNDNTNRYQSWHWRSSSRILLAVAFAVACSDPAGSRTQSWSYSIELSQSSQHADVWARESAERKHPQPILS